MKKVLALFGSLLVFTGVKAQTAPIVKKETTAPAAQPVKTNQTILPIKDPGNTTVKKINKVSKIGYIKKTNVVPMKENSAIKPDKH